MPLEYGEGAVAKSSEYFPLVAERLRPLAWRRSPAPGVGGGRSISLSLRSPLSEEEE